METFEITSVVMVSIGPLLYNTALEEH
jgi:hypothetical protein